MIFDEPNQMPSKTSVVLKALLNYSSDIIIFLATDFTLVELNSVAEKFYHWQQTKIVGADFLALCASSNYTSPIHSNYFSNPTLLHTNVGNINWVVYPIMQADQKIDGAILIGKEIGFKKNNIAYYLNEIINAIPGCLYWKDCSGRYLGCNALTAQLAGLESVYDIVGKTDEELWGKQANWLIGNDKQVIETGKSAMVEEKLQTADGRWLYFTGIKMPLRDENDAIIGIIGNSLEITELKITQSELKKSKETAEAMSNAKSEFIANMSHDVKTPLSGIIGLSEILLDRLKGDELELAQNIVLSGQQLMNFFNNCIDIAKSDETNTLLATEQFNFKSMLDQVIELFRPAARDKNLSFNFYYDNKIPECLIGSRVGIYRIMLNLIGNAIKFTKNGGITIRVNSSEESNNTQAIIQVAIEDTGIGIPKDKQKIIFERFARLTPSYKGIYDGNGIGLHLTDKLIKAMQGEIYVNSETGKGSQFVVVVPFKIPENDKISLGHKTQNDCALQENIEKLTRILLVEDNLIAQKVSLLMLEFFSHHVDVADCGETALKLFSPGKYDVVLMDIGLPDMSGYDVTRILREMEKDTSYHVPIIAVTAHDDDIKNDCAAVGMQDVLSKPLSKKSLHLILKKFIAAEKNVSKKSWE